VSFRKECGFVRFEVITEVSIKNVLFRNIKAL
jgi:hypothetical protein